ncbi:MAG TPA: Uma2 family endonuclease, partial [Yinghuangia sp.]|nr:Uma2 family endonuclease [Yinghuangia sp.]
SPSAVGKHGGLLRRLDKRFLDLHKPDDTEVSTYPVTIDLPNAPGGKESYVPDLVVVDEEVLWDADDWRFPADVFHLVAEVVSAGRDGQRDDRYVKPLGYASGPVPLYLLIDPLREEVTLFVNPKNGKYRSKNTVSYGDKLTFPEPFDAILDTSIFVR